MSDFRLIMQAVHGQGWQTPQMIAERIAPDPDGLCSADPTKLAPALWWLSHRTHWLVERAGWYIEARLAPHMTELAPIPGRVTA